MSKRRSGDARRKPRTSPIVSRCGSTRATSRPARTAAAAVATRSATNGKAAACLAAAPCAWSASAEAELQFELPTPVEALIILADLAVLIRVLLRPHREPASRIAWAVVIVALPVLGIIGYLLLGEVRISLKRRVRGREIEARLPRPPGEELLAEQIAASFYAAPFALGRSINCLPPTNGNEVRLAADSNVAIDEMVADIDAASSTVHLCAYIWLADNNGCKIKD